MPRKRPHDGAGGGGALTKSARAGDGAGGAGMVPGGTRLPRGQGVGVGEQLNFVLRCHPNEASVGRLTREYLRTSSELKVSQLKKFLGLKLSGTAAGALEILVHDPDEDRAVILHNQLSLADVHRHFWHQENEMILHFRTARPVPESAEGTA